MEHVLYIAGVDPYLAEGTGSARVTKVVQKLYRMSYPATRNLARVSRTHTGYNLFLYLPIWYTKKLIQFFLYIRRSFGQVDRVEEGQIMLLHV